MSQTTQLLYYLALLFEKVDITKLQYQERVKVIAKVQENFVNYLQEIINRKAKNGDLKAKSMAIRLGAAEKFHDPKVFEKFPELTEYLQIACQDFLQEIKN